MKEVFPFSEAFINKKAAKVCHTGTTRVPGIYKVTGFYEELKPLGKKKTIAGRAFFPAITFATGRITKMSK
jgi:hypothetical protein